MALRLLNRNAQDKTSPAVPGTGSEAKPSRTVVTNKNKKGIDMSAMPAIVRMPRAKATNANLKKIAAPALSPRSRSTRKSPQTVLANVVPIAPPQETEEDDFAFDVALDDVAALDNDADQAAQEVLAQLAAVQIKETPQERRDRVVLEHLPLVRAIGVRVHENLPVHVDLDDLIHAGIMGLFDAATRFDPEKNVSFSSYAKHRIKGAILDSLRQLDWASRDMRRRHKQLESVTRELAAQLQRNPTEEEVAAKMGVDVERWRQMMLDLRQVGLVSASTRGNETEDLPAPDFPGRPDHQPDNMCAKEELRSMLDIAMEKLPERYKMVVRAYYVNEMTMKEIGVMMGINESRVSQIHKSALEKMALALSEIGVNSSSLFC
jgi:RNA polymerase sigma factor FliA